MVQYHLTDTISKGSRTSSSGFSIYIYEYLDRRMPPQSTDCVHFRRSTCAFMRTSLQSLSGGVSRHWHLHHPTHWTTLPIRPPYTLDHSTHLTIPPIGHPALWTILPICSPHSLSCPTHWTALPIGPSHPLDILPIESPYPSSCRPQAQLNTALTDPYYSTISITR